jgi:hypothetical protein
MQNYIEKVLLNFERIFFKTAIFKTMITQTLFDQFKILKQYL